MSRGERRRAPSGRGCGWAEHTGWEGPRPPPRRRAPSPTQGPRAGSPTCYTGCSFQRIPRGRRNSPIGTGTLCRGSACTPLTLPHLQSRTDGSWSGSPRNGGAAGGGGGVGGCLCRGVSGWGTGGGCRGRGAGGRGRSGWGRGGGGGSQGTGGSVRGGSWDSMLCFEGKPPGKPTVS